MSEEDSSTAGMISREPSHSSFAMADENDERSQSNTAMFTQNPAAHVFRSMQKLAFGHISTDSLADLDTGMSRSTSTGSVNSVGSMDNRLPPQEQGLAMAAAARNVFQAWEENISTNTGCKSMGNLQALDTAEGSPREAEGSAEASYFAVFFSTLDKFLSANAQVGELKDDAEASSPFPRVC